MLRVGGGGRGGSCGVEAYSVSNECIDKFLGW